ncbi:MAG TPA: hypothetical protein VJU16_04365, partial [Planctomycetota bacterium]|nr:hypothetical protein [Planctomycetota bacterium]
HFVAHSLFNLLLIFPVLLGVALGFCIKAAAVNSRCRRPAVLVAVALVAGLAAYGFRQTLDTIRIQNDLKRLASEKEGAVTINGQPADLVQLGFSDTLRLRAEIGIGFGRARSATRNTLRGAGFWIFLLVEAGIAAGMAAAAAYTFSRLPYCGRCRQLIPSVPVFRVNARDASRLTHFIRHQKWKESQEMTDRASATDTDRAEAVLLKCGGCNASSIRVDVYEGRRSKKIMHAALPPESLEALAKSA